jgi:NAD-dependent SIR2 family protein deacetylase
MPTIHGHVEIKRELPQYATCVECHRTYRPRSEDQACMELCDECFESAKYPREQVISVHVRPRVDRPKSDVPF